MGVISTLYLSSYFIEYVIFVVLIGILITGYSRRNREKRKPVSGFLVLSIGMTLFLIIDTYRFFVPVNPKPVMGLLTSMAVVLTFLFISISVRAWKFMDKKLFSGILISAIVVILGFGLTAFSGMAFESLNSISMLGVTFLYCFFLINLLISSPGNKK
jgi:hypothetical protein